MNLKYLFPGIWMVFICGVGMRFGKNGNWMVNEPEMSNRKLDLLVNEKKVCNFAVA